MSLIITIEPAIHSVIPEGTEEQAQQKLGKGLVHFFLVLFTSLVHPQQWQIDPRAKTTEQRKSDEETERIAGHLAVMVVVVVA